MRKCHAQYVSGRLSKTVKFLDGLIQNYAKFFEVKKQMRQKWAKNFQNVFVPISQDWMRLEAPLKCTDQILRNPIWVAVAAQKPDREHDMITLERIELEQKFHLF